MSSLHSFTILLFHCLLIFTRPYTHFVLIFHLITVLYSSGLDATDFEGEDEDISMLMDQEKSVSMYRERGREGGREGREGGRDRIDLDSSTSSSNSLWQPSNQLNITQSSLTRGLNCLDINTSKNVRMTTTTMSKNNNQNQNVFYHDKKDCYNNQNDIGENNGFNEFSVEGEHKKTRYNNIHTNNNIDIEKNNFQNVDNSFDRTINEDITISNQKRSYINLNTRSSQKINDGKVKL
jgi:hypothetical protein